MLITRNMQLCCRWWDSTSQKRFVSSDWRLPCYITLNRVFAESKEQALPFPQADTAPPLSPGINVIGVSVSLHLMYELTRMIWQSANFGRKFLICTCPQRRSNFFFCLISPLFKLLHVKVHRPWAVPQHRACCWRATSQTPTHNNIKRRALLLLSQESCSASGAGGSITTFVTDQPAQWTALFLELRMKK